MPDSLDPSRLRARRIVTGHDGDGRSVIASDSELRGTGLAEDRNRSDAAFFQVWATHETPVDNSDDSLAAQQAGSETTVIGSGHGTVLRIGVLAPGARSPMHRTLSVDYGICLEGECDLELDSGESVTVRTGDVVVQRGTNHVWHNRGEAPCKFAWVLIDARPVIANGEELGAAWIDESVDQPDSAPS